MATVKDPICGKDVDTLRARAVGIYGGVTYYFCSQECKARFVDPRKAPRAEAPKPAPPAPTPKITAKPTPVPKKEPPPPKKDPTPAARKDPSINIGDIGDELPPMPGPALADDAPFEDLTPDKPIKHVHSPSVMAEVHEMKKGNRRWAMIIVLLAMLVVAAAVLSLRN